MNSEEFEYFLCPYCGQENTLPVDMSGGSNQRFVVDCEVCCAPISVRIKISGGDIMAVDVSKENE